MLVDLMRLTHQDQAAKGSPHGHGWFEALGAVGVGTHCLCACRDDGCYRNYVIPRDELKKLDGFEDSPKRRERPFRIIQSADHSDVRFDATTQLMVEGPTPAGGQFSQIRVTPTHFDGVLLDGQSLHLDLGSIQSAELRAIDGLPTALVAGTITAVGLVVLAGVIFVGSGGLSW